MTKYWGILVAILSLALFTHNRCNEDLPLRCLCLFTLNQEAAA